MSKPNVIPLNKAGITFKKGKFLVTSELGSLWGLKHISNCHDKVVIVGCYQDVTVSGSSGTKIALIEKGEILDERYKEVYPPFSKQTYKQTRGKIKEFEYDTYSILPIICYEILFPSLWMSPEFNPDFVTHHIGFPMFDIFQLEGWVALQEIMADFFDCPVVVSCGGPKTKMNLTRVVYPGSNQNGIVYSPKELYQREFRGGHV